MEETIINDKEESPSLDFIIDSYYSRNSIFINNTSGERNRVSWKTPVKEYFPCEKTDIIKTIMSDRIKEDIGLCSIVYPGKGIKIIDKKFLIKDIVSNDEGIFISKTMNKTVFSKKIIYYISFTKKTRGGYIKINFIKGGYLIHGIFVSDKNSDTEFGVLIKDPYNLDFWCNDVFLQKKRINTSYYRVSLFSEKYLEDSLKYMELCSVLGITCTIEINTMTGDEYFFIKEKMKSYEYVKKYIENFSEFIREISKRNHECLDLCIIFEPLFLYNVYILGTPQVKNNPELFYCNLGYTSGVYNNLVEFIKNINSISYDVGIELSHVFSFTGNVILCHKNKKQGSYDLFTNNIISEEASSAASFLNFFIEPRMKYISFTIKNEDKMYQENDSWINCLLFVNMTMTFLESLYSINNTNAILVNTPAGHVNNSLCVSNYTNEYFENHSNQNDSDMSNTASLFFLGGRVDKKSIDYRNYVSENVWGDACLEDSFDDCLSVIEHIEMVKKSKIVKILFGPSCNFKGVSSTPEYNERVSDHNYIISKISSLLK